MITLLKKHWLKIIIGIVIPVLLYGGIDGLISKYAHKKQIKELDKSIATLEQRVKDSEKREDAWREKSGEYWDLAMEKEAKLRKKDKEMRVKVAEKRELKKKIKEMPASIVVVQTIAILNCDEITEQQQGIVFSLSCAKTNLETLVDSFSLKYQVEDWTEKFNLSQGEVSDLKNVIIGKDGEIKEVKDQLKGENEIIKDWTAKFNLSVGREKSNWWKGVKTGTVVGAALVVLIKLVF